MTTLSILLPVLTFVVILRDSVSIESCTIPLIGGRSVPVKNARCVVSNWENMTCSWDLQTIYEASNNGSLITALQKRQIDFSSQEFKVTLEWTVFTALSLCRRLTMRGSCLTCRFLGDDGRDSYMPGYYFFQINITNTIQNSTVSSNISIATDSYVQPSKVTNIKALPNRTEVKLTWRRDKPWYAVKFRIRYISSRENRDNALSWKVDYDDLSDGTTIGNLSPNTEYIFQISCIPIRNGKNQGYWSDHSEIIVRTKCDVPGDVPYIRPSFYHCLDPFCSNIALYWQPISDEKQHGTITHYRLKVNGVTKFIEANVSTTVLTIDESVSTSIHLTQASVEGFPRVPDASITIPPFSKRLREPTDLVVEAYNTSYIRLRWKSVVQGVSNISFVVVRCKKDSHGECSEFIKFKTLSSSVNESYMNFFGIDVMEQKFGIAIEAYVDRGSHVSSGIVWSECTYQRNAVSSIPLRMGIILNDMGSDSMILQWQPYDCEESQGYLLHYILDYCRMGDNCSDSYESVNIDSDSTNYTLTNLLPGKYQSWIRGKFAEGVGPYSETVHFVIHNKKQNDKAEWVIVVLLAVMISFLVTVFYCICHTRRNIKKEIPIDIPQVKSTEKKQRMVSAGSSNSSIDSSYGSDRCLLKQSASSPDCYIKEENDSLLSKSVEQTDTLSNTSMYVSDEDYVTDQSNEEYYCPSYVKNYIISDSPYISRSESYTDDSLQGKCSIELKHEGNDEMKIPTTDKHDFCFDKTVCEVKSHFWTLKGKEPSEMIEDYSGSSEEAGEYTKVQLNQYLVYPDNVDGADTNLNIQSSLKTGCYTEGYVHC